MSVAALGALLLGACASEEPRDRPTPNASGGLSGAGGAGALGPAIEAGTAGRSTGSDAGTTNLGGGGGGGLRGGAGGRNSAGAQSVAGAGPSGGNGVGGYSDGGNSGNGGEGEPSAGASGRPPVLTICPGCRSVFDGSSLAGWVQVPANSWTVTDGALHSLGTARGVAYTTETFADFRFIFQSRLVRDTAKHLPCVLFFGNALTKDALQAIQVQPPNGYMWDYRATGPTANQSPDQFETRFAHPALTDATWNQCEMLGNRAAGTMRLACCQLTSTGPCKASEVVAFKDPTAGKQAPLGLQVHNAGMVEEFRALFVESPVTDPSKLLTTQ